MELLIAFILFILAYGIYILLFRCVILEVLYRLLAEGPKGLKEYLLRVAIAVDETGNATYPVTFTLFFVQFWTGSWYEFGNSKQTVSYVLALNNEAKKLSRIGRQIYLLLEWLDPGHGKQAIESYNRTCSGE